MDATAALGLAGTTLASYFAIMNPVASTSVFVSLTDGDDAVTKRSVAVRSLVVAFGIVVVVSLAGNLIFKLFGISLATLRITGGIVLFIIGYQMLQGASSHSHKPSDADVAASKDAQLSVAVSPLGIPMLAGPGTIATAMTFAAGGWLHIAISLASFTVICAVTYCCFHYSDRLVAFLGQNGMNVVTRLMGLIVASIGVGMLLAGLDYHAAAQADPHSSNHVSGSFVVITSGPSRGT